MKPDKNPQCDGTGHHVDNAYTEHPLVYLAYDQNGFVLCPYCGKKFTQDSIQTDNEGQ